VRLTVLGCSGTFPGPDSPCSGYLVEHEGYRLVLDLGSGALGALQRHCDLLDVDALYVSHLHADHCIDLVAYSYARRYHPRGTPPRLPVYGPAGTARRICQAFEDPPPDGLSEVYDVHETGPGRLQLGPLTLTTVRTNHPVEAHAVRVEAGGRSLTYSADTAVSDALVELARGTDLFLCEASWSSEPAPPPDIHLTGAEAGEHATRAGVGRLLLTHLMPFTDATTVLEEARASWAGPLGLARCDETYEV
jgi:ribonuclease BN (tRNA processing enzyme)